MRAQILNGLRICLYSFLLLWCGEAYASARLSPPNWFWGCWVVTKVLPTSAIIGIGPEKEKSILGTHVAYAPDYARAGNAVIHSPQYTVDRLSQRQFFDFGHYPLSDIGIHKKHVLMVSISLPSDMSDLNFIGATVFLRDHDLVLNVENDTFLAVRVKNEAALAQCSSPMAGFGRVSD